MPTPLIYNLMTQDQNQRLLDAIEGRDIAEVIAMLSTAGNRYSRRILRFFRWFCKWMPLVLMLTHFYGVTDFARNPHEMFVVHDENAACACSSVCRSSTFSGLTPYISATGTGTQRPKW